MSDKLKDKIKSNAQDNRSRYVMNTKDIKIIKSKGDKK